MARHTGFNVLAAEGDAHKIVAAIPFGSKLRLMSVHGAQYWFARTPAKPGVKSKKVYVGSDANKAALETAWATVQAAIDRAAETRDGRRLLELQELAGGPPLARTTADSPLKLASGAGRGGGRRPKR